MSATERLRAWLRVAIQRAVLGQALVTALVVGTVLMVVNHGDALLNGRLDLGLDLQIALTYLVPFLVSVTSSAAAVRRYEARSDRPDSAM